MRSERATTTRWADESLKDRVHLRIDSEALLIHQHNTSPTSSQQHNNGDGDDDDIDVLLTSHDNIDDDDIPHEANFIIQNISIADEGTYRCRVDFNRSPTRNSVIHLSVIGK